MSSALDDEGSSDTRQLLPEEDVGDVGGLRSWQPRKGFCTTRRALWSLVLLSFAVVLIVLLINGTLATLLVNMVTEIETLGPWVAACAAHFSLRRVLSA